MYFALLILTSFLALLLFLPLKVVSLYENKLFVTKVFIGGICVFKLVRNIKKMPDDDEYENIEQKVEKTKKSTEKLGSKIQFYFELSKTATKLARKFIEVKNISLEIMVGTGDAPSTAISTGILWAVVYNFIGIIGNIMFISNHNIEITPEYSKPIFSVKSKCIFKSRIVYIIFIAITILIKIKTRKGKEE